MTDNTKLTLSEAKLIFTDYILDTLGFEAEPLIDKINSAKDINEIKLVIDFLIKKTPTKYASNLLSLWNDLLLKVKNGQ